MTTQAPFQAIVCQGPTCTCDGTAYIFTPWFAHRLNISERTLYRMIDAGTIPDCQHRIGNGLRLWSHTEFVEAKRLLAEWNASRAGEATRIGGIASLLDGTIQSRLTEYISLDKLAEVLEIPPRQVYEFTRSRAVKEFGCRLMGKRLGPTTVFHRDRVLQWLDAMRARYERLSKNSSPKA